jgi:multiple sugar transport system ATP-binding protein
MAVVQLKAATRQFTGMSHPAVDDISLEVGDAELLVLVGPSGCGKSTLLRMVAGLERLDEGVIEIDGRDVTDLAPKDRNVAMVFQSYALYPHMTVAENIGFNLKLNKVPKDEMRRRVDDAARLLDLADLLDRKPAKLSGGQRQRVAMGRAIVREPSVFLMDEPLSNLDAKLRVQTRTQIAELQRRLSVTTVYVTHDQVEAMTMADRVAVLRDGILQQVATPRELFSRPVNTFVAGFIGSPAMNLVTAPVGSDGPTIDGWNVGLSPAQRSALTGSTVTIGIRPESLEVTGDDGAEVTVSFVEDLGSDSFLHCVAADGTTPLTLRRPGLSGARAGDRLRVRPVADAIHRFDGETGRRLPDE